MLRHVVAVTAALLLAACSSDPTPVATPDPEQTALPERCHLLAKEMMRDALATDGNLDGLPKEADRSLGIPACKGLTSEQLDEIALALQEELKADILDAALRATPTP